MPLQGRLSIEHMCQLVALSRRGFYRSLRQREPAEEETEVRSLIQQIPLEHRRRYGYRRITTGQTDRSVLEIRHAQAVDPLSYIGPEGGL